MPSSVTPATRETAKSCLVTFGSYVNAGRLEPSYAFVNTCNKVIERKARDVESLYLLANGNDWYRSGIKGFGDGLRASAADLRERLAGYERKIFVGNSMGAYGALAFGYLSGATSVVAFSPQTRFDRPFLDAIDERRWRADLDALDGPDVGDMAIARIGRDAASAPSVTLYVGGTCTQDMAYADETVSLPGVRIEVVAGEGHDLVHALRETRQLAEIIAAQLR